MNRLYGAAKKAIKDAIKVKRGEKVLLVTDKQKMKISEALAYWCKKAGAEVTTYLMTETLRPITGPTKMFEEMIKKANVTMYLLDARVEEKPFRSFMVANGQKCGRICMMPGITVDMMQRLVNINFGNMIKMTNKLVRRINNARKVHITNPFGTDIKLSVKGRHWKKDIGDISRRGEHGNLPTGEIFTAPVERTLNGRIVFSLIDDKVGRGTAEFKKGKVIRYSGKGISEVFKNIGSDKTGKMVGEFGIGTNRGAKICKNMLEAEKAFGTVHFAIGDSYGLGKNRSRHHYDMLIDKVTLVADKKIIMKNGRFLI